MTTDDLSDVFDTTATETAGTTCRDCGRTVRATVPEMGPQGDRWIRCQGCETINRVTNGDHAEAGGGADAE